ncbi:hypothetical protein HGM15179_014206 [Zosterops borbonicus]|uniref:Uncharacterized protein n=1 Tax=Zosterops borbonicus TaxID=364589 RepID=A0A8K1G786_9PASS|nr:hypothetical protein HGM15179_014206 [Zosterops borbonicus]
MTIKSPFQPQLLNYTTTLLYLHPYIYVESKPEKLFAGLGKDHRTDVSAEDLWFSLLLKARLNNPSSLSHSSQGLCSKPLTSLVASSGRPQVSQCPSQTEGPELDTALEVWPDQCPVQGKNDLPAPAGHTIPDPDQDAFGLPGHQSTLLAHVNQYLHVDPATPITL